MRGLTGAAAALLLCLACARGAAAPRIVVEQPVYDFGTVTNGSQVLHDFVVRNAGDADLEITRVASSCPACLQAGIERKVIVPGGRTVLHARLDLQLLDGPVIRLITLVSNDPATAEVYAQITGVAVPLYRMTPSSIEIDLSQGQPEGEAEVEVMAGLRAPLSRVQCGDRRIAARVSPDGTDRFRLTARASGSFAPGVTAVDLTLRSADRADPPCRATCFVRNPPNLELVPDRLRFEARPDMQTRILWMRQHGAAPLILLDAVPPSASFHCEIDPDPAGYDYRIYITAWGLDAAAGGNSVLTLKMRDKNQIEQSVSVPILLDRAAPGGR